MKTTAKQAHEALDKFKEEHKPKRVVVEHKDALTKLERFAIKITDFVGSMKFFIMIFIWTLSWLGWNTLAPYDLRFDPTPAFVMWLFMSNMIQIFLMPLIMIGQNLQSRHTDQRSENDYDVDVRTEKELEVIMLYLEHIHDSIDELKIKHK